MENRLDRLGRYMNWKQHGIYILEMPQNRLVWNQAKQVHHDKDQNPI